MSGSPKYTWARLRAAEERMLRQARSQAAAFERAQRRAEEDRLRANRLAQLRREVTADLTAMRQQVRAGLATDAGRQVRGELAALQAQLDRAEAALALASNFDEVRPIRKQFRGIGTVLWQALARGQAACRAAGLAATEAALLELKQQVAAIDAAEAANLAPQAVPAIQSLLAETENALRSGGVAKSSHSLDLARQRLEQLLGDLNVRKAQWTDERDRCQTSLVDVIEQLAGLRADPVVARWALDQVNALQKQATQVQPLIDAGQFVSAARASADVAAKVEQVVASAQERQLQEDRRTYIVNGIVQIMNQMGFVVQAGSPALEHPGVPTSATIVHARRIGGGTLAVSVPQEGNIWYSVDEFPMRVEPARDGQVLRSCMEAEQQIEQLHAALDQSFGIETGELQWQDKPTALVGRQAERLPDIRPEGVRQEGGS